MLDETRRGILRMFGVTAAAAAATAIPSPALDQSVQGPTGPTGPLCDIGARGRVPVSPLEMLFQPPPGITYNWKRVFIDGEMADFDNIFQMIAGGWKPVPRLRHRELLPDNGAYWIEHGGLVLMEKPTDQCAKPVAYPAPFAEPTGEYEHVIKMVIPDGKGAA